MGTYLLEMKHITKKYGENTVLKDMEPVSYTHLTLPTIYSV